MEWWSTYERDYSASSLAGRAVSISASAIQPWNVSFDPMMIPNSTLNPSAAPVVW